MMIKQIVLSLMLLIFSINITTAQDDAAPRPSKNYFLPDNSNWKTELQIAKESDKVIFVQLLTDNCPPCDEIKNMIWKNEEIGRFYVGNFLIWAPAPGSKDEKNFKKKYRVKSYPTSLFIAPDGSIVHKFVGLPSEKKMMEMGNDVLNNTNTLAFYKKMYKEEGDEMGPEKMLNYAICLMEAGEDYNHIIDAYFKTQTEEDLFMDRNIKAIMLFTDNMYSREFRFLVQRNKELESSEYSEVDRTLRIEDIISNTLNTAVMSNPKISMDDTLNATVKYFEIRNPESLFSRVWMDYYDYVKPEKQKYFSSLAAYMESHVMLLDAQSIMDYVERVANECNDRMIIDQAVMWANEALAKTVEPGDAMYLGYIDILVKDRRYAEAMETLDRLAQSWFMKGMPEEEVMKKQDKIARAIEQAQEQTVDTGEDKIIPVR
jgi:thiol-disulfide isomerase/thioredoxin